MRRDRVPLNVSLRSPLWDIEHLSQANVFFLASMMLRCPTTCTRSGVASSIYHGEESSLSFSDYAALGWLSAGENSSISV